LHFEKKYLKEAVYTIKNILEHINRKMNLDLRMSKLLSRQIKGSFNLLKPNRYLIREGKLRKSSCNLWNQSNTYIYYLFNDCLLWTTLNNHYVGQWPLTRIQIIPAKGMVGAIMRRIFDTSIPLKIFERTYIRAKKRRNIFFRSSNNNSSKINDIDQITSTTTTITTTDILPVTNNNNSVSFILLLCMNHAEKQLWASDLNHAIKAACDHHSDSKRIKKRQKRKIEDMDHYEVSKKKRSNFNAVKFICSTPKKKKNIKILDL